MLQDVVDCAYVLVSGASSRGGGERQARRALPILTYVRVCIHVNLYKCGCLCVLYKLCIFHMSCVHARLCMCVYCVCACVYFICGCI